MPEPLIVDVTRGRVVESRHRVHAVVAEADGKMLHAWGDPGLAVLPRSSIKPIQALPLIETGAADRFSLSEEEIALACASHDGAPVHVEKVKSWLQRVGIGERALQCGPQRPIARDAADALLRGGHELTKAHNNCSGKHAGFLTTAAHLGEPAAGYIEFDHPAQRRVTQTLREFTDVEIGQPDVAVDGCGIPTIAFPIRRLAMAAARFAAARDFSEKRAEAVQRIRMSIAAAPEMIAGPKRFDTIAMKLLGERAIVKSGAEGTFMAMLFEPGLGMFLKVEDGAGRAADIAAANLLSFLGVLDAGQYGHVDSLLTGVVNNTLRQRVGEIRTTVT
ncbi:MAG: asparaginase [Gammaproteobacteria bacterium]